MKKTDNKGFSLVELIIVVAIMAILMTVLALNLLPRLEQTRCQKDNSALSELAEACKIACNDEATNAYVYDQTDHKYVITITGGTAYTFATSTTNLIQEDLHVAVGSINLTSNTYKSKTVTVTVTVEANGTVKVEVSGYLAKPGATATTYTF